MLFHCQYYCNHRLKKIVKEKEREKNNEAKIIIMTKNFKNNDIHMINPIR